MTASSAEPDNGPSQQADVLLTELRNHALERGWKAKQATDLPIGEVWQVFDKLPLPFGREDEFPRSILAEHLAELRRTGGLGYADSSMDREKVPLPKKTVRLLPYRPTTRLVPREPVWHSSLAWASDYWSKGHTTDLIREAYTALNIWLHGRPSGPALPARERALQIFGPHPFFQHHQRHAEKVLDSLKAKPLFSDSARLLSLINAFRVDPPLLTRSFDTVPVKKEGGYHRIGHGRGLLVIENSTTYWSVSHMLKHINHSLGYVAWGNGSMFTASIGSLTRQDGVSHVRYFGDLDATGLRTPLGALQRQLPDRMPVRPAIGLYELMFQHGIPSHAKPKEANISDAELQRLAGWLDPRHQDRAVQLLSKGMRLAQEGVNLGHLSASTGWHSDMA